MGYYSDVGVCLTFKDKDNFKAFAAKAILDGVSPAAFDDFREVVDVPAPRVVLVLYYESIKWYQNDPHYAHVFNVDQLWEAAEDEESFAESGMYITVGEDGVVDDQEFAHVDDKEWNECYARDYLTVTTPQIQTPYDAGATTAKQLINGE